MSKPFVLHPHGVMLYSTEAEQMTAAHTNLTVKAKVNVKIEVTLGGVTLIWALITRVFTW